MESLKCCITDGVLSYRWPTSTLIVLIFTIIGSILVGILVPPYINFVFFNVVRETLDTFDFELPLELWVFNLTNADQVLQGEMPVYTEVGPYIITLTGTSLNEERFDGKINVTQQTTFHFDQAATAERNSMLNCETDRVTNINEFYARIMSLFGSEELFFQSFGLPTLLNSAISQINFAVEFLNDQTTPTELSNILNQLQTQHDWRDIISHWRDGNSSLVGAPFEFFLPSPLSIELWQVTLLFEPSLPGSLTHSGSASSWFLEDPELFSSLEVAPFLLTEDQVEVILNWRQTVWRSFINNIFFQSFNATTIQELTFLQLSSSPYTGSSSLSPLLGLPFIAEVNLWLNSIGRNSSLTPDLTQLLFTTYISDPSSFPSDFATFTSSGTTPLNLTQQQASDWFDYCTLNVIGYLETAFQGGAFSERTVASFGPGSQAFSGDPNPGLFGQAVYLALPTVGVAEHSTTLDCELDDLSSCLQILAVEGEVNLTQYNPPVPLHNPIDHSVLLGRTPNPHNPLAYRLPFISRTSTLEYVGMDSDSDFVFRLNLTDPVLLQSQQYGNIEDFIFQVVPFSPSEALRYSFPHFFYRPDLASQVSGLNPQSDLHEPAFQYNRDWGFRNGFRFGIQHNIFLRTGVFSTLHPLVPSNIYYPLAWRFAMIDVDTGEALILDLIFASSVFWFLLSGLCCFQCCFLSFQPLYTHRKYFFAEQEESLE